MRGGRRTLLAVAVVVLLVAGAGAVLVVRVRSDHGSGSSATCATGGTASKQADEFVTRTGSHLQLGGRPWRFGGVNMYWLGLDDNVTDGRGPEYPSHAAVDNGLDAARALGARVVRSISLGVSVGGPRTLEPRLGHFNDAAFASIDYAVAAARRCGLRLVIPLTDQMHYYHGGKHTFTNWLGHPDLPGQTTTSSAQQRDAEANFYTDPAVFFAFRAYVTHLLRHRNPLTGLRLGQDPTVAVWETGNEVFDAPTTWTEQTAALLKSLAPRALVADGSASTGKDVRQTAVDAPDVDIVDGHFYPTDPAKARGDAAYVTAHGKAYVVGEYPVYGHRLRSWLQVLGADRNVSGDLAWSLLPYLADGRPERHRDGYTFHYPGVSAAQRSVDAALRAHARQMAGGS